MILTTNEEISAHMLEHQQRHETFDMESHFDNTMICMTCAHAAEKRRQGDAMLKLYKLERHGRACHELLDDFVDEMEIGIERLARSLDRWDYGNRRVLPQ